MGETVHKLCWTGVYIFRNLQQCAEETVPRCIGAAQVADHSRGSHLSPRTRRPLTVRSSTWLKIFCKKSKNMKAIWDSKFLLLALSQFRVVSGCLLRTSAGRRDSFRGRTRRQWTKPLGAVDKQIKIGYSLLSYHVHAGRKRDQIILLSTAPRGFAHRRPAAHWFSDPPAL